MDAMPVGQEVLGDSEAGGKAPSIRAAVSDWGRVEQKRQLPSQRASLVPPELGGLKISARSEAVPGRSHLCLASRPNTLLPSSPP